MSPRSPQSSQSSTQQPQLAPVAPTTLSPGTGGDYMGFVWQQLSDIQKTLGGLDAAVKSHSDQVSKLGSKIEDVKKDIHGINVKLASAAAVVGAVLLIASWAFSQIWDVAKPILLKRLSADSAVVLPVADAPVGVSKQVPAQSSKPQAEPLH